MLFNKLLLPTLGYVLFGLSYAPSFAQEGSPRRQLAFLPSEVTETASTDSENPYSWPSFQVTLQEAAGEQWVPAEISGALRERLEAAFALPNESLLQAVKGTSGELRGFEIPGGSNYKKEYLQLQGDMSRDFARCLALLGEREIELVKSVMYNLSEAISILGEVNLNAETLAAVQTMTENYRQSRCAGNPGPLPDYTLALIDRFMGRLLSGEDPSDAISDQDLIALTQVFKDFIFSSEGLWVRVSRDKIQSEVTQRLQQLARIDQLDWVSKPFIGFVDFVVATRGSSGLTREDYLTLAESCGVNDVMAIFSDFSVEACHQSERLDIVDIVYGDAKGLVLLPRSAAQGNEALMQPIP